MDMQFTISGIFQGNRLTIRWFNGRFELLEGDQPTFRDLLSRLEETAADLQNVNFTAMTIQTDFLPTHMACPFRLMHLLAYETVIPPLMSNAEVISAALIDDSLIPEGAKI
jgi:hypothetical protein